MAFFTLTKSKLITYLAVFIVPAFFAGLGLLFPTFTLFLSKSGLFLLATPFAILHAPAFLLALIGFSDPKYGWLPGLTPTGVAVFLVLDIFIVYIELCLLFLIYHKIRS